MTSPEVNWPQKKIPVEKLYDLGKFFFTAGTATLAFLAAAEKINTSSAWHSGLILAAVLLACATVLAAAMVIGGCPYAKTTFEESAWPTFLAVLWFALWVLGAGFGLYAVILHTG
jgi:hypothetical protein